MKKLIASLSTALLSLNVAYAGCIDFHIQISNLTKEACVLTSHRVIRGNLLTSPPMAILPNDSKRFDMTQSVFGPNISLSYQCGAENITFTSQQHLAIISAGNVVGHIVPPPPRNITAAYTAIQGSCFWDMPGSINWQIVSLADRNTLAAISKPVIK